MKTRNGFVSNSSTSSFLCQISGEMLAATDGDYETATCTCDDCGAEFLGEYVKIPDTLENISKEDMIELLGNDYYSKRKVNINDSIETIRNAFIEFVKRAKSGTRHTSINHLVCPVCQMYDVLDIDLIEYLLRGSGMTRDQVESKMKEEFGGDILKFRKANV
jgi:hypothetical protein